MHLPAFLKSTKLHDITRLICLALTLVMFLVALTIYHADLPGILVFAFFILCYVQLPGQFLLRLLRFRPDHLSTLLACGFFTGWAFVTTQYFITELIRTNVLLYGLGPVCTGIWLCQDIIAHRKVSSAPAAAPAAGSVNPRSRQLLPAAASGHRCLSSRQRLSSLRNLSPAFCIFVTIGLLYCLLLTQYLYLSPAADQTITMNPDKGFHIGLINSLSHGWPLECPWFAGLYYNYHIFTELLLSVPVRLFGLTADSLLFCCGPYLTVYTLSISCYAFFREFSRRGERAGLYCLLLLLSNIFIARGPGRSIALLFFFRNENVAGYGLSCALVLMILIRCWYRDYVKAGMIGSWRTFVPVLALLMLNTGIKGPFGLVILASMWGTFLLGLILGLIRRQRLVPPGMLLPLLVLSAGFYLIYAVVLGSKGQSVSAGESLIALGTLLDITFYKGPMIALMKSLGLPSILRYLVLLLAFTVCLLTVFFLPFLIGYVRELFLVLTGRRDFDFPRILVYAGALVGFIAMLLLNYHGHSQIYFGFLTCLFGPMIALWFLEDMEEVRNLPMQVLRGILVCSLVLTTIGLASFLMRQTADARSAADPAAGGDKWMSISQEEYRAMRWIDENTPRDSLLATDRYYTVDPDDFDVTDRWDNRFFLYADYSNRICYLAGAGYNLPARDWKKREERIAINDRLFDVADPDRGQLARSLGIDYVVVSKRFTDCGYLGNADYQRCFSNDDIDIYKITD